MVDKSLVFVKPKQAQRVPPPEYDPALLPGLNGYDLLGVGRIGREDGELYAPPVQPVVIPAEQVGAASLLAKPPQPPIQQQIGTVAPEPIDPLGNYEKARAELRSRLATDPSFQFRTGEGRQAPTRNAPLGPDGEVLTHPIYDNATQRQTYEPSLDAALLASGIGALLGTPGFGFNAGTNIMGGVAKGAAQQDAVRYKSQSDLYDDAERAADRQFQNDTSIYNHGLQNDAAWNNMVQRRIGDAEDTIASNYRTDTLTADKQRAEKSKQDRETLRGILRVMESGSLDEEGLRRASEVVSKISGEDLDFMANMGDPYTVQLNKQRINYLRMNAQERLAFDRDKLTRMMASAEADRKARLAAVDKYIQGTLSGISARIAGQNALAQFKADHPTSRVSDVGKSLIIAAAADVRSARTTMRDAQRELSKHEGDIAKLYGDKNLVDVVTGKLNGAGQNKLSQLEALKRVEIAKMDKANALIDDAVAKYNKAVEESTKGVSYVIGDKAADNPANGGGKVPPKAPPKKGSSSGMPKTIAEFNRLTPEQKRAVPDDVFAKLRPGG